MADAGSQIKSRLLCCQDELAIEAGLVLLMAARSFPRGWWPDSRGLALLLGIGRSRLFDSLCRGCGGWPQRGWTVVPYGAWHASGLRKTTPGFGFTL